MTQVSRSFRSLSLHVAPTFSSPLPVPAGHLLPGRPIVPCPLLSSSRFLHFVLFHVLREGHGFEFCCSAAELLSQLDNPTMGCQVWLDRPLKCGLVLPPEIQRQFSGKTRRSEFSKSNCCTELGKKQRSLIGDFNVELAVPEPGILPEIQEPEIPEAIPLLDTETRPLGDRISITYKTVNHLSTEKA